MSTITSMETRFNTLNDFAKFISDTLPKSTRPRVFLELAQARGAPPVIQASWILDTPPMSAVCLTEVPKNQNPWETLDWVIKQFEDARWSVSRGAPRIMRKSHQGGN